MLWFLAYISIVTIIVIYSLEVFTQVIICYYSLATKRGAPLNPSNKFPQIPNTFCFFQSFANHFAFLQQPFTIIFLLITGVVFFWNLSRNKLSQDSITFHVLPVEGFIMIAFQSLHLLKLFRVFWNELKLVPPLGRCVCVEVFLTRFSAFCNVSLFTC